MNLFEMWEHSVPGFQDLEDDNSVPKLGDLRKTKLTLRQINKLRRLNDVRTYEYKEKLKQIKKQYAVPTEPTL